MSSSVGPPGFPPPGGAFGGPIVSATVGVDHSNLRMRPIERTDVEQLAQMFDRLTPESFHARFFSPVPLSRSALERFVDVDHCRRDALVVLDEHEIVAAGSYDPLDAPGHAAGGDVEIAIAVDDRWQRRGLGRRLAVRLGTRARDCGYDALVATILPDNRAARALVVRLAPDATMSHTDGELEARIPLTTRC